MELTFDPIGHRYESVENPERKWKSVTGLISKFKNPFEAHVVAERVSKKKSSKWYGLTVDQILAHWDAERRRSTDLGTWYHNREEQRYYDMGYITKDDIKLPVIESPELNNLKLSSPQKLENGVYPEHIVYMDSYGVCGQVDRVEVLDGVVDIHDYKTNKKIDTESYVDWEGKSKMLLPPLNHLEDCNLVHYSLQMSLYMYMILAHNPRFKPGELVIHHVKFLVEETDENGFPITSIDEKGDFIVTDIQPYKVPYLMKEAKLIIESHDD